MLDSPRRSAVPAVAGGWSRPLLEVLLGVTAGLAIGAFTRWIGSLSVLLGVVAVVVVAVAFVEPRLLLLLLVPAIALSPELDIAGLPLRIEDFLFVPLAFGWLLQLLARRTSWPRTPLTRPILTVLTVNLVATLLGTLAGTTTLGLTNYSGLVFWLKEVEVFLLFFITVDTLGRGAGIRLWAYLLAFSGTALALQGMVTHLRSALASFISDPKGGATYSLIALSLLVVLCLVLGLLLMAHGRVRRLLLILTLVPLGYTLAFTFSRQAYIGIGAALLVLAYLERRRMVPVIALIFLAAYLFAPQPVVERTATLLQPVGQGLSSGVFSAEIIQGSVYGTRFRAWQRRLPEVLSQNPLTGLGAAALPPGNLDSQYLAQVYYYGLFGLAAFFWLLWRTGRVGWQLYRQQTIERDLRGLGLGLLAATVGMAVAGLGGMPFIAVRSRELFWFLAALTAAATQIVEIQATADQPLHQVVSR